MLLPDPVLRNLQEVESQIQKVTTDVAYDHCGPNSLVRSILFALIGFTGDVIIEKEILDDSNDPQTLFILNPAITFISDAERQAIDNILKLGTTYKHIETFIRENEHAFRSQGLYVRALCISFRSLLSEYQSMICKLETELKTRKIGGKDPFGNIAIISTRLHKFSTLLPEINRLLDEVQWQNLQGAQLLQLVWSMHLNGVPLLQNAFAFVLQKLHEVFYDQCTAFCVHGQLTDRFNEFIIEQNSRNDSDWSHLFKLRWENLPTKYIPVRVCEKVKFVGQAVKVLRETGETHLTDQERLQFTRQITILKRAKTFELQHFENWLDSIKGMVARRLMGLMKKHNLKAHMEALRNYFCCYNGSFWHVFLEEAVLLLHSMPGPTANRDISAGPWQNTMKKLSLEDSPIAENVSMSFDTPSFHAMKKRVIDLKNLRTHGAAKVDAGKNANPPIVFQARSKQKCGSIMSSYKMPVTRGFCCKFRFSFPDKSATGFAFVLQNDRKDWVWASQDLCGCAAILYSLAVTFRPIKDGEEVRLEIVKTGHIQDSTHVT